MALVQVKQVFRVGLVQKVTRYVSPPQPSSTSSFLWKSDSMSRQRRNVILAQVAECRSSFFTSTIVEDGSKASQGVEPTPEETSTTEVGSDLGSESSNVTDADVLDRTYGQEQHDHHKVAENSHEHYKNQETDDESLASTGFDISKVSKPSGEE